jgi:hypothetical protein
MVKTLDELLSVLPTQEAKSDFLESAYYPGNIDVADKLQEIAPESFFRGICQNEIKFAKGTNFERFNALGKAWIDYDLKRFPGMFDDDIKEWVTDELRAYAIEKLMKRAQACEAASINRKEALAKGDETSALIKEIDDLEAELNPERTTNRTKGFSALLVTKEGMPEENIATSMKETADMLKELNSDEELSAPAPTQNYLGKCMDYLVCAEDIAKVCSSKDLLKEVLEYFLKVELQTTKENRFCDLIGICEKLGRYEEGIDFALKDDEYRVLCVALDLAKERAPAKLAEVAGKVFESFDSPDYPYSEDFVSAAEILGVEKDRVREKLLKCVREFETDFGGIEKVYLGFLKSLNKLGLNAEAREIAEKIEKHEDPDNYLRTAGLARLFYEIDPAKTKSIFIKKVETEKNDNLADELGAIYELSKDPEYLDMKIKVLLHAEKYEAAEKTALQIGKTELAEVYHQMKEMTAEAKEKKKTT